MSQKERILELLKNAPDNEVSCNELATQYLFHKAASRVSELRKAGWDIKYIPGPSVMDSKYKLINAGRESAALNSPSGKSFQNEFNLLDHTYFQ